MEGIKIDDMILQDLACQCNYDARSSINSLQFLRQKFKNERITRDNLLQSSLYNDREGGVKDTFTNVFDVSDKILIGKNKTLFGNELLRDVKRTSGALGDY